MGRKRALTVQPVAQRLLEHGHHMVQQGAFFAKVVDGTMWG